MKYEVFKGLLNKYKHHGQSIRILEWQPELLRSEALQTKLSNK
jgi:hypothetical protein